MKLENKNSKIYSIAIICLSVILFSYSKENSVTNPGVIIPPDPVTPKDVKVTSFTPEKPIWGDVIEIIR